MQTVSIGGCKMQCMLEDLNCLVGKTKKISCGHTQAQQGRYQRYTHKHTHLVLLFFFFLHTHAHTHTHVFMLTPERLEPHPAV